MGRMEDSARTENLLSAIRGVRRAVEKITPSDVAAEAERNCRQSIVDNLSALVARRQNSRLDFNYAVTEAIKEVARGIATGKY
jgi:hypothetical protein